MNESQDPREPESDREIRGIRPAVIVAGGLLGVLALMLLLRLAVPPAPSVDVAVIDRIEKQLVQEGFKVEANTMMVDEISLGPADFLKRPLLSKLYPGYQTRSANRLYSRNGAQLGIDYQIINNKAVNIALPADPAAVMRARQIFREIAAANPSVAISLRTNITTVERSLNAVR
jgi:hypothetical protein